MYSQPLTLSLKMKTVTALKEQRRKRQRINVYLDGAFAFSVPRDIIERSGVQVGQALSTSQIEELTRGDLWRRCHDAALLFLSYRPRSEMELKDRLRRRGFSDEILQEVVSWLRGQGLVDDLAFAEFWRDNRESFSPRSQYLLRLELWRKGVDQEVIAQVLQGLDEDESAYQAARKKVRRQVTADYQWFRRRVGEYLKRRGFGFRVINHTLERLWEELSQDGRQ